MVQFDASWGGTLVCLVCVLNPFGFISLFGPSATTTSLHSIQALRLPHCATRDICRKQHISPSAVSLLHLMPPFFQQTLAEFLTYGAFRSLSFVNVSIPTVSRITLRFPMCYSQLLQWTPSQQGSLFQKRKIINFLPFHLVEDRMKQRPRPRNPRYRKYSFGSNEIWILTPSIPLDFGGCYLESLHESFYNIRYFLWIGSWTSCKQDSTCHRRHMGIFK